MELSFLARSRLISVAALAVPSAVAVALVCAGISVGASALGSSRAHQAIARCSTPGMSVWIEKPAGNGALGSRYYYLRFTNLSGHTCELRGVPGVSAVSLSGARLGAPAGHVPARGPAQILKTGATTSAQLKITVAGAVIGCHPRLSAGLRIYPPDNTVSRIVPFPAETCPQRFMFVSEVGPNEELEYP
ncbi:MAG TPA: DUF4232 domain-containing protein [Solirubrobacteraceae bacterium]|nr:DUF4232 domain-containing protein [Solirubrobacteraceae bacterium]